MIVWPYLVSLIKPMCIFRSTAGRVSLQTCHAQLFSCVYFIRLSAGILQRTTLRWQWAGLSWDAFMQSSAQVSKASSTLKCKRLLCLLAVNLLVSVNHSKPGSILCCHLKIRSKQKIHGGGDKAEPPGLGASGPDRALVLDGHFMVCLSDQTGGLLEESCSILQEFGSFPGLCDSLHLAIHDTEASFLIRTFWKHE